MHAWGIFVMLKGLGHLKTHQWDLQGADSKAMTFMKILPYRKEGTKTCLPARWVMCRHIIFAGHFLAGPLP